MMPHRRAAVHRSTRPRSSGLYESLPLLVGAGALFLAGFATWLVGFTAGPARLPLWSVFVVAGSIALVGAVLSWRFAAEPSYSRPSSVKRTGPVRDRLPPTEPEAAVQTTQLPRRTVAPPVAPLAPWDEGTPELRRTVEPARGNELADRETQGVLDEIDSIQSELSPRRPRDRDRPE